MAKRVLMWRPGLAWDGASLALWPGKIIEEGQEGVFEAYCERKLCAETKVVGCVEAEGRRRDLFFYVRPTPEFCVQARIMGMRWWDDVAYTGQEHLYPEAFVRAYPFPDDF